MDKLRHWVALVLTGLAAGVTGFTQATAPLEMAATRGSPSSPVRFVDIADQAGVTAVNVWGGITKKKLILETKGNGVGFLDYDGDGWIDIYLSNGTRLEGFPKGQEPTNHLYHNNRDGSFSDVTARSGLARTGWQTGVCSGDYDNDGWDDLFLSYWGQNHLYRNNGNGTFADVTERAGLKQSRVRWGTGCAFLDYDRDGSVDLFVANFIEFDPAHALGPGEAVFCYWKGIPVLCGPKGLPAGKNVLYHNNRDGTFTDVSESSGIAKRGGNGLGALSYDFDNDGWPDIYVANDSTPSLLYHNNHDGTFSEIGVQAGVAYSEDGAEQGGMGVAVGDYDADGWFDIFKTNFADDTPNLYHNNGDGTFTDRIGSSGLGVVTSNVSWGNGFVDVDNDGWKDIFYVNGHVYPEVDLYKTAGSYRQPRLLYRNLGDGRYQNISVESGPGFERMYSSRGCAFGDFNNDGGADILIMNMNEPPSLWRNESQGENHSLVVKLTGTRTNRSAIGARVRVTTGKHPQIGEVHSGDSVMSMSDLRLHFGLGSAKKADLLEVRWPMTGAVERFENVAADQIVYILEGSGIVRTEKFAAVKVTSRPSGGRER